MADATVARKAPAKKAAKKAPAKKATRKAPAKKAPAKKVARKRAAAKKVAAPPPGKELDVVVDAVVDVPNPYDKARRAHEMIVNGHNWDKVADELDYPSTQAAAIDVRGYLKYVHVMTADDERQLAKRLELDRLDMLLQIHMPAARLGDKDSAAIVLKAGERRAKLLELEAMSQRQSNSRTIVLSSENMAAELRAMAEERERETQDDVVDAEVAD